MLQGAKSCDFTSLLFSQLPPIVSGVLEATLDRSLERIEQLFQHVKSSGISKHEGLLSYVLNHQNSRVLWLDMLRAPLNLMVNHHIAC